MAAIRERERERKALGNVSEVFSPQRKTIGYIENANMGEVQLTIDDTYSLHVLVDKSL